MIDDRTQRGATSPTLAEVEDRFSMPIDRAMESQRAVRRLHPDPVDDAIILRCLELALRAPTGSNGQNWEFIVVKDSATKRGLGRRYRQGWSVYGGLAHWIADHNDTNPLAAMLARLLSGGSKDTDTIQKLLRAVDWQVDHFEDLPVLVVCCLRGERVPGLPVPPFWSTTYYGSIYPAAQNLLLAARAVGLGGSLITLPLWNMTSARRILGLPVTVRPCCIVPLGWPIGRYGLTTRKPVGEVTHLDRYGRRPWA